jgi:8-oxo-dGTP pyrophosphatase MutT (NUDIX family)
MVLFRKKHLAHSMKNKPSRLCTLTIVAQHHAQYEYKIALAQKQKRLCRGKMTFPGGRVDKKDRSIKQAALRELKEELGVTPENSKDVCFLGIVRFFVGKSAKKPSVTMHVFWYDVQGGCQLHESDELKKPRWFILRRLPWKKMMPADRTWFRSALGTLFTGLRFREDIWYNKRKTRVLYADCHIFFPNERVR